MAMPKLRGDGMPLPRQTKTNWEIVGLDCIVRPDARLDWATQMYRGRRGEIVGCYTGDGSRWVRVDFNAGGEEEEIATFYLRDVEIIQ